MELRLNTCHSWAP